MNEGIYLNENGHQIITAAVMKVLGVDTFILRNGAWYGKTLYREPLGMVGKS